jgi:hypothetical protein
MLDDSGELGNIIIWCKEAHVADVMSSVREVQTKFGVYVAAGSIVLTPPKSALLVSGTEEANSN